MGMSVVAVALSVFLASEANALWANKLFGERPGAPIAVDLGTTKRGDPLQTTLKITNIYRVPIEISVIRPGSGMLSAKASKSRILPRETVMLTIEMDTARFVGEKTTHLFVTFGPDFVSTVDFAVTGVSRDGP